MNAFAKGIPWLAFLLCLSHLTCLQGAEEEALLLDDKDFCTVPGAADVKACDWIVEQLEDQNPDLTYDFFCSKEEDCDNDFVEGGVVDWFSGGCNGPKIINKLCGCCVFNRNVAPGTPTNLAASEVTISSATITWADGAMGFPLETYTVRCFDEEPEDCGSAEFAEELTGIPRGVEEVTLSGLDPNTEYSCFVLAINPVAPDGICSDTLAVTTLPLQSLKLVLVLTVDNCEAFGEVAVVEAYCEAFIEEAGFPANTACLTEESSCMEIVEGRRGLLVEEFEATIVFAGDFEGEDPEEVEAAANAVLNDDVRFSNVQSNAIVLLTDRGTEVFADALGDTSITGGTSSAEDAEPECNTSEDCDDALASVCSSGFCVACGPIQVPAIQGNCLQGALCALDGACMMTEPPGTPSNLTSTTLTASSATIIWTDGSPGFPEETYTVRCFDKDPGDCRSMEFAAQVAGIPRGIEEATVMSLEENTEYLCFVIATNLVEPQGVCSDPLFVFILTGVCGLIGPTIEYRQTFTLDAAGWFPLQGQEIVQSSDFSPQFRSLPGVGLAIYPDGTTPTSGPFTRFGKESPGFPINLLEDAENGFVTQIAIYLNVSEDAPFSNDMRFDWSIALSTKSGDFIQDFVFNAGWYNDASGPGAGETRFVVSGSNNAGRSNSSPKNPGRDPIAIFQSGWHLFQHFFYANGNEVFGELSVYTDDCLERLGIWTLGPARVGGTGPVLTPEELGLLSYGWFVQNELPTESLVIADQLLVFPQD